MKDRAQHLEPSTLKVVFFGTLVPMFNAAVANRRIGVSPCAGIRLPEVPDAKYTIPRPDEVPALARALPERYRAIRLPRGRLRLAWWRDLRPKTSARTNELPAVVADVLRADLATFPVRPEEIEDETDSRRPVVRPAHLIFTRGDGRPIRRSDWSHIWRPAVRVAGLPLGFGLRDLRHYFRHGADLRRGRT